MIKLYHGDCLKLMFDLPDNSVDMVCCDMPYGTTACKWDTVLPLDMLWYHYKRIVKDNGAIVLTASQPFTSTLIHSNPKTFKYCWIWEKSLFTNFAMVKKQPAKKHEDIVVFYDKQPSFHPQMESGKPYKDARHNGCRNATVGSEKSVKRVPINNTGTRYPSSVQKFSNGNNGNVHPTQKPVELIEYLIKTYTNEGDTVLDNCMGSGTTGVACQNLNRKFIGIELDDKYFQIAKDRIEAVKAEMKD